MSSISRPAELHNRHHLHQDVEANVAPQAGEGPSQHFNTSDPQGRAPQASPAVHLSSQFQTRRSQAGLKLAKTGLKGRSGISLAAPRLICCCSLITAALATYANPEPVKNSRPALAPAHTKVGQDRSGHRQRCPFPPQLTLQWATCAISWFLKSRPEVSRGASPNTDNRIERTQRRTDLRSPCPSGSSGWSRCQSWTAV